MVAPTSATSSTTRRSIATSPPSSANWPASSTSPRTGASSSTTGSGRNRIKLLDFLRDVGRHATVNQMVARESVRIRMESEQGISYTEFSYMLLQANDYLWLHDHLGCDLQIGGSDQWGNILSGVDLIRRARQTAVHAMAWPLLTAADGSKIGKTTGARVWLDPDKTSPYRFHQHWMQLDDAELEQQFPVFSLRPLPEIEAILERPPGRSRAAAWPAGAGRRDDGARARRRGRRAAGGGRRRPVRRRPAGGVARSARSARRRGAIVTNRRARRRDLPARGQPMWPPPRATPGACCSRAACGPTACR